MASSWKGEARVQQERRKASHLLKPGVPGPTLRGGARLSPVATVPSSQNPGRSRAGAATSLGPCYSRVETPCSPRPGHQTSPEALQGRLQQFPDTGQARLRSTCLQLPCESLRPSPPQTSAPILKKPLPPEPAGSHYPHTTRKSLLGLALPFLPLWWGGGLTQEGWSSSPGSRG